MPANEVWLINGIPGSGKTTLARSLAAALPKAAHVEGDALQLMVVAGRVLPGQEPAEESEEQIHLCVRHQCLLARSFAQAGFIPVLDYVVVSRERVEEYRRQLEGLTLRLVTLAPDPRIALQRDETRPEKTVAAAWVHLDSLIRQELEGVGLWVDNASISIDDTVSLLLSNSDAARV